ncbi:signal peptidase I [Sphingomonas sp. RG327]|uniref:Signal peptidase I n=1 Tax=Sphingomonas anseongensis TaxID=2908207 RepID=A0ABT0RC11_9SPHN|nr:signal peptidase I [Sphingomonas anseongensis]MCL6677804.1 signal peptidase I [Sphingomonas anseongensis]
MNRSRSRKTAKSERGSLFRFVLTVAVIAWLFRSLVFAPFSIPSGSMLPALYIGDYLVVAKWPYGLSRYSFPLQFPPIKGRVFASLPERGDVVVFVPPGRESEDYVKRLIGLPGDTVAVRDGVVILNGKPVARGQMGSTSIPVSANSPCRRIAPQGAPVTPSQGAQCVYRSYVETLPNGASYRVLDQVEGTMADNFGPVRIPAGHAFLMGDNRDDSLDSRFSEAEGGIGFVPLENIVGRATMIFWSTDGSSSYLKPWTWFTALRGGRIGDGLSPNSK